jgi:membrane protein
VAAPGSLNARRQRQPFAKTKTASRHGASGDLLVMAALIGISRVFLAPKKHGQVGRMARAVKETPQPESGRGREADSPHEIPARGWKDVAWRVYEGVQNNRVLLVAAGVTFYALLALFPATAAIVSLYGLFADAAIINEHLGLVSGFMPAGALEVIGDQVKRIASQGQAALGFTFFSTLVVALWGANAGTKSIFDALNIIYKEREKRSFIGLTLQSLGFTVGAVALVLMAIAGIVVVPVAIKLLGIPEGSGTTLLTILRWPLLYFVILFALACLYRYGPSRTKPRWRWVTWGSAIAGGIWIIGSLLLSWYIANFGNYNATYGSLGAVIGFMVWIWLSTIIVLLGGEVNAEMEHQTAKDTTDGERKPLGTRGAQMADNIGKASS